MGRKRGIVLKEAPTGTGAGNLWLYITVLLLAASLVVLPASAEAVPGDPAMNNTTGPQVVQIGIHVMDIHRFNLAEGTFEINFYLHLKSDSPVSLNDFEIINGRQTSVDTLVDTPDEKIYRVFAIIDFDPDLRQYPFDRHVLPIVIEPKVKDERDIVLVVQENSTLIEPGVILPGWHLNGMQSEITSKSYPTDQFPYSRAVFRFSIQRETASIIVKFFLPILLLLIITLSSLLMRGPYRLSLNATMLVVAVFIHWRTADAIPLVAFATFLDSFMVITYLIIILVLVSGILLMKYTESNDTARAGLVQTWSVRGIPALFLVLYSLLFLTLLY